MSRSVVWFLGMTAAIVAVPYVVPGGMLIVVSKMLIAALLALSFNLLAGQAGMLSFGHAAYWAFGTFATVHMMQAVESGAYFPTVLLPLVGAVAGLITGGIAGMFATRRTGVYFSMITLAIAELAFSVAPTLHGAFGGEGGLSTFRMPWWVFSMGTDLQVYVLVAFWVLAAGLALYLYQATPFGRLTLALRENETRVRFLGYNTYQARIAVFAISSMFAGLSGGLLAVVDESANYVLLGPDMSAAIVLNTFIGGSRVFLGPAIGAMFLTAFNYLVSDLSPMIFLYEGALFILVMIYAPSGLCGLIAMQIEPVREGWWRRLVWPYLGAALPLVAMFGGGILFVELLQRFFASSYVSLASRTGNWPSIAYLGLSWSPFSPLTWLTPIVITAVGIGGMMLSMKVIRRAWGGQ